MMQGMVIGKGAIPLFFIPAFTLGIYFRQYHDAGLDNIIL